MPTLAMLLGMERAEWNKFWNQPPLLLMVMVMAKEV